MHPTPYPEVNAIIRELQTGAQAILRENFIGMYLHGSLASGDFNPETSDIDFVVVTAKELTAEIISALENLHNRLNTSNLEWAKKLEGTYIPQKEFRRYDPNDEPYPCTNEGKFYLASHENHWVLARHILCENGVIVAGADPKTLIDPVSADEIRQAVIAFLNEWWSPMLDNPFRLQSAEYQAYAVLTMCRALYTLENGTIASKPVCARWAQETLDQRWTPLIDRAWVERQNPGLRAEADDVNETLNFIRYTLANNNITRSPTSPDVGNGLQG